MLFWSSIDYEYEYQPNQHWAKMPVHRHGLVEADTQYAAMKAAEKYAQNSDDTEKHRNFRITNITAEPVISTNCSHFIDFVIVEEQTE